MIPGYPPGHRDLASYMNDLLPGPLGTSWQCAPYALPGEETISRPADQAPARTTLATDVIRMAAMTGVPVVRDPGRDPRADLPRQFFTVGEGQPAAAPPGQSTMLAASAARGDSHIWLNTIPPPVCELMTIGVEDGETHRLDLSMAWSHDGPGRHAVWLETTLRGTWPTGTEVTAG